jgi:hypothetical protein
MKTTRHLGKLILTLLLSALPLFAGVKATVDNPAVYRGDPVTLTLTASGDGISFPPLSEIAGYAVQSRSTSRNLMIDNGTTTHSVTLQLVFTPTKDVTIPAIGITVGGKIQKTKPLSVRVLDPKAAPKGAAIQMQMKLSQSDAYVGEPVKLDLVLRYKPRTRIDDIRISPPKLEHFWIKRLNQQAERGSDADGYITQTYHYLLFAQQSGDLTIPATFAQIGTRAPVNGANDPFLSNPFFSATQMQYRKVYSAPVTLHVKPLPQGLNVYGDFTMHAKVDKTTVNVNKPVNLHIHIEGYGNVEDIPKFDPQFTNAIVYANDPKTSSSLKDGKYYGTFDQTIAVIPDRDITIPPQAFRFFDNKTKQIKTLHSQPFAIKVIGAVPAAPQSAPVVESAGNTTRSPVPTANAESGYGLYTLLGTFAGGFLLGAAFIGMIALRRPSPARRKHSEQPMAKKIRSAKKDRALFELLLPHKGEAAVIDVTLDKLEANLYRGANEPIDRKALLAYFNGKTEEEIRFV